MKENKVDQYRRNFLKITGSVFIGGIAISGFSGLLTSCEEDEKLPTAPPGSEVIIQLSEHPELSNFPSYKFVKLNVSNIGETAFIIYRVGENEFIIFSGFCPHQGVELEVPKQSDGPIHCPRHSVDFCASKNCTLGAVVSNPQGVKLGSLKTYNYTFDEKTNRLIIKYS